MGYYDRYYKNEPCEWWYDHQPCDSYWYHTNHGVQPGSIPNGPGAQVLDIQDDPEGGHFFKFNKLLNTDALNYFDIQEKAPRQSREVLMNRQYKRNSRITASSNIRDIQDDVATTLDSMFREAIDDVMDNLAQKVASEVKSYDADWCEQDGYAHSIIRVERTVDDAVASLTEACLKALFADAR